MKTGLITLVFFLFFANGLLAQDNSKLKGEWLCSTEYGQVELSFINDSILVYDGEQFSYSIQQNYIVINSEGQVIYYPYSFQEGNLLVSYPEGYSLLFYQTSTKTTKLPTTNSNRKNENANTSGNSFLSGKLCEYGSSSSYSSYSSYSHLNWLYFDGRGNFQFGGEQSYSGESGQAYSGNNSGVEYGTYSISGNQVHFIFSNGDSYVMTINMVQNNGQITELLYGEKLYAAGLCE